MHLDEIHPCSSRLAGSLVRKRYSEPCAAESSSVQRQHGLPSDSHRSDPAPSASSSSPRREAAVSASDSNGKGSNEGITLHGHWTIEVRNPNGKVAKHVEFENALCQPVSGSLPPGVLNWGGGYLLALLLSKQAATATWIVNLGTFDPNYPANSWQSLCGVIPVYSLAIPPAWKQWSNTGIINPVLIQIPGSSLEFKNFIGGESFSTLNPPPPVDLPEPASTPSTDFYG